MSTAAATPSVQPKDETGSANFKFVKEMEASKVRTLLRKEKEKEIAKFNQQIGRTLATATDQAQLNQAVAVNTQTEGQTEGNEDENGLLVQKKKIFDPFSCPPDLDMAVTHLKASRIALEEAKPNSSITRLLSLENPTPQLRAKLRQEIADFESRGNLSSKPGEQTSSKNIFWDERAEEFEFIPDSEDSAQQLLQQKKEMAEEKDVNEYCPCCNHLVKTKFVSLADGIDGIKNLGVGFSLYFRFNYELMITIFLVSLVGIYMTVRNTLGTMCVLDAKSYDGSTAIPACEAGWITKVSISNYGLTKQDTVEKGLYFLIAVIVYGFSIFWYASLHAQADDMDELQDSPEDWTVLIKNIDIPHTQTVYIDKNLHLEVTDLDDYVKLLIENLSPEPPKKEETKPNQIKPASSAKPVLGVSEQSMMGAEKEPLNPAKALSEPAEKPAEKPAKEEEPNAIFTKYKVEDTNYVYKCKELVELNEKLTQTKQDIRRMLMSEPATLEDESNLKLLEKLNPKKNKDPNFSLGNEHFDTSGFSMDFQVKFIQAQFINTKLLDLIKEIKDARRRYYLGWVFVTFQTELMRDQFIQQFENEKKRKKAKGFLAPFKRLLDTITCSSEVGIEVSRAPNPEDIIWENLGTSRKERGKHVVISYSITLLVLGMNFGLTLLFNWLKFNYSGKLGTTLAVGLSALLSIFNNIFDQILTITINFFTAWENHETRTDLKNSILIKIFISQFVNTNLLTLISYVIIFGTKAQGIHVEGGILSDVVSIIISQLLVNPALVLVNPPFIIGFLKQYFMKLRVHYSLALSVTQQNAHDTFQYPEIGVSEMYSESLKPMMTAFFFLPMMPAGVFAAVGAAFLVQYANLFRLLRTSATPKPAGPEIAFTSLYLMNLAPLALAIGQLIFESIFRGESLGGNSGFAWAFFGVTMFFSLVPIYPFFKDLDCSKKMYEPVLQFFDNLNGLLSCKCCKKKPEKKTGTQEGDRSATKIDQDNFKSGTQTPNNEPILSNQSGLESGQKTKNYLNFYNVLNTDYKTENPVTEDEGVKARESFFELIKFINEYKGTLTTLLSQPLISYPHEGLATKFVLITEPTQRVKAIKEMFHQLNDEFETARYTKTLDELENAEYIWNEEWDKTIKELFGEAGLAKPTLLQVDSKVDTSLLTSGLAKQQTQSVITKDNLREATRRLVEVMSNSKDVAVMKQRKTTIKRFYQAILEAMKSGVLPFSPQIRKIDNSIRTYPSVKSHQLWKSFIKCRKEEKTSGENKEIKGLRKNNVADMQAIQDAKKRQKLANKINYTRFLELLKNFDQKVLEDTFGSKLSKFHYNQIAMAANTQQSIAIYESEIMKKMFN